MKIREQGMISCYNDNDFIYVLSLFSTVVLIGDTVNKIAKYCKYNINY